MADSNFNIGLMGLGEMGAAIGGRLTAAGHRVGAIMAGRGAESLERAKEAGIEAVADYRELAIDSDIVFSVLPPAVAEPEARRLSEAARQTGGVFVFVEANAIAPDHMREIATIFADTRVEVVDGGIVGAPPSERGLPRLYLSGIRPQPLAALDGIAYSAIWLDGELGTASGFKMSYAAVTKGVGALLTTAMLSAEHMGFSEVFRREFASSQPDLMRMAESWIPRLPADAGRWVREMEEIRDTFAALGLPPGFHQAAADTMRMLDASRFGHETRRSRDTSRGMDATLRALVEDRMVRVEKSQA